MKTTPGFNAELRDSRAHATCMDPNADAWDVVGVLPRIYTVILNSVVAYFSILFFFFLISTSLGLLTL